ncbi:MAG: RHS repeat-associated core domain-containing protein, partial [Bacteroidota bacterium]
VNRGTNQLTTHDYLNAFFYKDGQLQHLAHEQGRALLSQGSFRYEFNLTDHLGNVRVIFSDLDQNGQIEKEELLQEDHYYPFGMRMASLSFLQETENRFRYNGKELHTELGLGLYDYGARMYDPSLGRFTGVDALAEAQEQLYLTPYNYTWNNPINLTDPDGNIPIPALVLKGLIEGGIELGTQLIVNTAVHDGDINEAFRSVDWVDVGIATVAGMAPTPGSGKAALAARLAVEGGKALVDVNAKNGLKTSQLIGGEKTMEETVIDGTVGFVTSSATSSLIEGTKEAASKALIPSNFAPLSKTEKQAVRAENAIFNSKGFKVATNTSGSVVGTSTGQTLKEVTKESAKKTKKTILPMVTIPSHVQPSDATRTMIFLRP